MGKFRLKDALNLAQANYERGGDYVIELLTEREVAEAFCQFEESEGKKKLYAYMRDVVAMRHYIGCIA